MTTAPGALRRALHSLAFVAALAATAVLQPLAQASPEPPLRGFVSGEFVMFPLNDGRLETRQSGDGRATYVGRIQAAVGGVFHPTLEPTKNLDGSLTAHHYLNILTAAGDLLQFRVLSVEVSSSGPALPDVGDTFHASGTAELRAADGRFAGSGAYLTFTSEATVEAAEGDTRAGIFNLAFDGFITR